MDDRRVGAGLVVARARHGGGARERTGCRPPAGQAGGGTAARLEVVAAPLGHLAAMVHDDQLVGQVEDEIALIGGARQARADRLELEREIVAEGAVEPEVRLLGVPEELDQRAQQREHGGLTAPIFFREAARRCAHRHRDRVVGPLEALDLIEPLERLGDGGEQDQAAGVQGLGAEPAAPGHERERRIHEPHVPASVAAGVLVARCEQHAAARVEGVHDRLDGIRHRERLHRAVDADAPTREVAVTAHGRYLLFPEEPGPRRGRDNAKAAPAWGRLRSRLDARVLAGGPTPQGQSHHQDQATATRVKFTTGRVAGTEAPVNGLGNGLSGAHNLTAPEST